jgi:hypothetical protein
MHRPISFYRFIPDAASNQLLFDHALALFFEIHDPSPFEHGCKFFGNAAFRYKLRR